MVDRTGDPPRSPGLTSDDQQCVGLLDEIYISGTQYAEKSVVPEKVLLPFSDTAAVILSDVAILFRGIVETEINRNLSKRMFYFLTLKYSPKNLKSCIYLTLLCGSQRSIIKVYPFIPQVTFDIKILERNSGFIFSNIFVIL